MQTTIICMHSLHDALPISRPLKDHARVHFHSYTMESVAEIVLYTGKELDPTLAKNARMGHPGFNSGRAQLLPGHEVFARSEEHTSELQSRFDLVCRLLLEK